jgi:hypothetical protein
MEGWRRTREGWLRGASGAYNGEGANGTSGRKRWYSRLYGLADWTDRRADGQTDRRTVFQLPTTTLPTTDDDCGRGDQRRREIALSSQPALRPLFISASPASHAILSPNHSPQSKPRPWCLFCSTVQHLPSALPAVLRSYARQLQPPCIFLQEYRSTGVGIPSPSSTICSPIPAPSTLQLGSSRDSHSQSTLHIGLVELVFALARLPVGPSETTTWRSTWTAYLLPCLLHCLLHCRSYGTFIPGFYLVNPKFHPVKMSISPVRHTGHASTSRTPLTVDAPMHDSPIVK